MRFHNGMILSEVGDFDIFLARYSTEGNLDWARKAGSGGSDLAKAVETDEEENAFLTGYHNGAVFGLDTPSFYGIFDVFVAKYDSNGTEQWVVPGGDIGAETAEAIAVDASGTEIYVGGHFSSSTTKFGSITLTANGGASSFVSKLSFAAPAGSLSFLPADPVIFPNPASRNLYVEFPTKHRFERLEIYDCSGRMVYQSSISPNDSVITVQCEELETGIYFVRMRSNESIVTKRLAVHH